MSEKLKRGEAWKIKKNKIKYVTSQQKALTVAFPDVNVIVNKDRLFVYEVGATEPFRTFKRGANGDWVFEGRRFELAATAVRWACAVMHLAQTRENERPTPAIL